MSVDLSWYIPGWQHPFGGGTKHDHAHCCACVFFIPLSKFCIDADGKIGAIAGIGGGGIVTIVSIVVSDVVSLKDRGKYQSIIGVVVAVANATGPVAGGIFTEKISWRWCFYISIPFSGLAMVIVTFALPLKKVEGDMMSKTKKIDGWGCLASFLASIAILLSISWAGSRYPWDSTAVLAPLVIGIVLFGVFLFIELKVAKLPL